jgi:hypothetical protein
MKKTDEIMLIPQEEGFRAWRNKAGLTTAGETETKTWRGAEWIALPARCVVSVPMRFQGVDAARRESAAQLELEAAGLGNETAETFNFELHNLGHDERDQRTSTYIQVAPLPTSVVENGDDAKYAPSVAFQKLTPGELLIWREDGAFVIAIPHESGEPMHSQALAARTLDADAAAEIRCILASLELSSLTPDIHTLALVSGSVEEDLVSEDFSLALDLPVVIKDKTIPTAPAHVTRLVPASVVRLRQERQQRRMMILGALAFAFVLVAALIAFAIRVWVRERSVIREELRLAALEPELMTIRDAKAAWDDLLPALTPDTYPVESIYQLVLLLPPEGIRVTRLEVRQDGMIVDGEASSLGHGIEFRDKLLSAPAFKRWKWEMPQPTSLPDGRATFRAEARPEETATAETTEGAQP